MPKKGGKEAGKPHPPTAASTTRRVRPSASARSVVAAVARKVADFFLLFFFNLFSTPPHPPPPPHPKLPETTDRLPLPRARARARDRRLGVARQRVPGAPPPLPLRRRGMREFFFPFKVMKREEAREVNGGKKNMAPTLPLLRFPSNPNKNRPERPRARPWARPSSTPARPPRPARPRLLFSPRKEGPLGVASPSRGSGLPQLLKK